MHYRPTRVWQKWLANAQANPSLPPSPSPKPLATMGGQSFFSTRASGSGFSNCGWTNSHQDKSVELRSEKQRCNLWINRVVK